MLTELPDLPYSTVLELAYVEQRLSCWAGPGHYGNRTSRFELSPFASRRLFSRMLSLPLDYRNAEQLTSDVFPQAWPELLDLPFDEFTGPRGARDTVARRSSAWWSGGSPPVPAGGLGGPRTTNGWSLAATGPRFGWSSRGRSLRVSGAT